MSNARQCSKTAVEDPDKAFEDDVAREKKNNDVTSGSIGVANRSD
jgi:hypothetical protein